MSSGISSLEAIYACIERQQIPSTIFSIAILQPGVTILHEKPYYCSSKINGLLPNALPDNLSKLKNAESELICKPLCKPYIWLWYACTDLYNMLTMQSQSEYVPCRQLQMQNQNQILNHFASLLFGIAGYAYTDLYNMLGTMLSMQSHSEYVITLQSSSGLPP